jgi:hypothetical protein
MLLRMRLFLKLLQRSLQLNDRSRRSMTIYLKVIKHISCCLEQQEKEEIFSEDEVKAEAAAEVIPVD